MGWNSALDFVAHGASALILHYLGDEETEKEIQSLRQEVEKQHVRVVVMAGDIADPVTSTKVLPISPKLCTNYYSIDHFRS
jgi:L-rhamnose 1-dehydrogenase